MKQTIKEYIDNQNDFVTYYLMNTEMTVTEIWKSLGTNKKSFLRDIKEQRNGVLEITMDNIDELLEDADNDTRLVARCCAYDPSKVVAMYMAKHFSWETVLNIYVAQSMRTEDIAVLLNKPFINNSTVKNILQTTYKDLLKTVDREKVRLTKEEKDTAHAAYLKHVEDNPIVYHSVEMGAPVILRGQARRMLTVNNLPTPETNTPEQKRGYGKYTKEREIPSEYAIAGAVKSKMKDKFTPTKYVKDMDEYLNLRNSPDKVQELINKYLEDNNQQTITRNELRENILGLEEGANPLILAYSGYEHMDIARRGMQTDFVEYITSLVPNLEYKTEYTPAFMGRKELDLYFPEVKLAFEFNGSYWHSDAIRPNDYHQKKSELANKSGVNVVHVQSNDWQDKRELVNEFIKKSLSLSKTPEYDELLNVKIDNDKAINFINVNSLYDFPNATSYKGIYSSEGLCAVIPFDDVNKFMYEPVTKQGISLPDNLVEELRSDYGLAINLDYNNLYDNAATQQGLELEDIKLDRKQFTKRGTKQHAVYLAGTAYFK